MDASRESRTREIERAVNKAKLIGIHMDIDEDGMLHEYYTDTDVIFLSDCVTDIAEQAFYKLREKANSRYRISGGRGLTGIIKNLDLCMMVERIYRADISSDAVLEFIHMATIDNVKYDIEIHFTDDYIPCERMAIAAILDILYYSNGRLHFDESSVEKIYRAYQPELDIKRLKCDARELCRTEILGSEMIYRNDSASEILEGLKEKLIEAGIVEGYVSVREHTDIKNRSIFWEIDDYRTMEYKLPCVIKSVLVDTPAFEQDIIYACRCSASEEFIARGKEQCREFIEQHSAYCIGELEIAVIGNGKGIVCIITYNIYHFYNTGDTYIGISRKQRMLRSMFNGIYSIVKNVPVKATVQGMKFNGAYTETAGTDEIYRKKENFIKYITDRIESIF